MKIYKSLDFSQNKNRIEETPSGENILHDEDYESINDLIRRAERTRTKFVPETSDSAEYDFDEDELSNQIRNEFENNLSQNTAVEPSEGSTEGKRSEPAVTLPDGKDEPSATL